MTYRKLEQFATEAKKIMQTCTGFPYLGKNTTHTEVTQLLSIKRNYSCVHFQKNLHEDKRHYLCLLYHFDILLQVPLNLSLMILFDYQKTQKLRKIPHATNMSTSGKKILHFPKC